jgi:nuclease HARBI1
VSGLSARQLCRMYRLSKEAFEHLVTVIGEHRQRAGRRPGRHAVDAKLSMALRWLAGGSYLDIALAHCVSVSTFFRIVDETICDIDDTTTLEFRYEDEDYLKRVSVGFARGRSPLYGYAGAIDGIAIKVVEPWAGTTANSSTYFNRKGFFALNVHAMCDCDYKFTFASALCPGSTHDSTAFSVSSLSTLLNHQEENILLPGFWITGDEAYVCEGRMLTPWPGRSLSQEKDCFNYWLSSARIHTEQAFGMLIGRWGVFWRPLRTTVDKVAQIVLVCMKLHNFVLKADSADVPLPSTVDICGHTVSPDYEAHEQDQLDTNDSLHRRRRDLEGSEQRIFLTSVVADLGLAHPGTF